MSSHGEKSTMPLKYFRISLGRLKAAASAIAAPEPSAAKTMSTWWSHMRLYTARISSMAAGKAYSGASLKSGRSTLAEDSFAREAQKLRQEAFEPPIKEPP